MEEQEKQERTSCPRCAYFVELGPPDIDEQLKKDYVRSLYGSRPFTWVFTVQGIKYTFQSLTRTIDKDKERVMKMFRRRAIDNNLIDTAAELLQRYDAQAAADLLDKKAAFNIDAIDSSLALLDAYYTLMSIEDRSFQPPDAGAWKTPEDMLDAIDTRFGDMSREAATMIIRLSDVFNMTLEAAKEACLDENFWKGAGFVQSLEVKPKA